MFRKPNGHVAPKHSNMRPYVKDMRKHGCVAKQLTQEVMVSVELAPFDKNI